MSILQQYQMQIPRSMIIVNGGDRFRCPVQHYQLAARDWLPSAVQFADSVNGQLSGLVSSTMIWTDIGFFLPVLLNLRGRMLFIPIRAKGQYQYPASCSQMNVICVAEQPAIFRSSMHFQIAIPPIYFQMLGIQCLYFQMPITLYIEHSDQIYFQTHIIIFIIMPLLLDSDQQFLHVIGRDNDIVFLDNMHFQTACDSVLQLYGVNVASTFRLKCFDFQTKFAIIAIQYSK